MRGDPLAIHILIVSASDVIRDCAKERGIKLKHDIMESIRPEMRKEVADVLRKSHNFLRHANKDADTTIDVSRIDVFNDGLIALTSAMYHERFGENTKHMSLFRVLTVLNYPHLMTEEYRRLQSPNPGWTELTTASHEERYDLMRTMLETDAVLLSEVGH